RIDITDRNGILVASHPDIHGIGHPISDELKPFLSGPEMGVIESVGFDGIHHLYGYIPVNAGPSNALGVFVGRNTTQAVADIDRSIWLNMAGVAAALLLSGMFASLYVRGVLALPFENLLRALGRLRGSGRPASAGPVSRVAGLHPHLAS